MDETRRGIFTTTVLAAIGGLAAAGAAGALTGFGISEAVGEGDITRGRYTSPVAGSVVAVYGTNTYNGQQNPSLWYFFKFDNNPSNCELWVAPSGTPFPTLGPASGAGPSTQNAIDTWSWYKSILGSLTQLSNTTLEITYNPGKIEVNLKGTYLDNPSLASLLSAFVDMSPISASWNEIGKS